MIQYDVEWKLEFLFIRKLIDFKQDGIYLNKFDKLRNNVHIFNKFQIKYSVFSLPKL